jgi:tetratricopeptide (TPR) repeat protein
MSLIHPLRSPLALVLGTLLALPFTSQPVEGQAAGRMRVLVANLTPPAGGNTDFGEDLANELRDQIDLPTHVALSDDDIDDAAREYGMRLEGLDCNLAQQLAVEMEVGMVYCGEYTQSGTQVEFNSRFIAIPSMSQFQVAPFSVGAQDIAGATNHVMTFFQTTIEKVTQVASCLMEFNSSNWQEAVTDCGRATEVAPEALEARSALASAYLELEQWNEALEQLEVLLEADPFNVVALEAAGFAASQVDNREAARDYYLRYMELNPQDIAVRIRVAADLAERGDNLGGMQVLEAGIEQNPDNLELHEQYGSMAARAAIELQAATPSAPDAPLDPEIADMYRKAITSLNLIIDRFQQEALPEYVGMVTSAHVQLGQIDQAIAAGERGIQLFPDNAQVRNQLATAYAEGGQIDRAVSTLEEAIAIDPQLPNAYVRMGQWLLEADRVEEAGEAFLQAAERGEQPAENLATLIFAHGVNVKDQQQGDLQGSVRAYEIAKQFQTSSMLTSQINFFHGYALYRIGDSMQQASTVESAQGSTPIFREALQLFNGATEYGASRNVDQLIAATNNMILIQESIIARATGGA